MDGIGEQGHRTGDHHDDQLGDGGGAEGQQADLHRPDARGAGFQRSVDAVGGVVAVRGEDFLDRSTQTLRMIVIMNVFVVVTVAVVVPMASRGAGFSLVGHARRSFDRAGGSSAVVVAECTVASSAASR